MKKLCTFMAMACIVAGSMLSATVSLATGSLGSDRILELKDVWGLKTAASVEDDGVCHLRVSGLAFHSALVVEQVKVERQGDQARIRVALALAKEGRTGFFDADVPIASGLRSVVFGNEGSSVWTSADGCDTRERLINGDFFAKGGLGLIRDRLYVVIKSDRNELILPPVDEKGERQDLPSGKRWTGQEATRKQVVVVSKGKVVAVDAPPEDFALADSIIISFEGDRVAFLDVAKGKGGYYRRPTVGTHPD